VRDERKFDHGCLGGSGSFSGPSGSYGPPNEAVLELLSNQETASPALAKWIVRSTKYRAKEVEGVPITTDTHVRVIATTATVQFPGEKSSHRPLPPWEAARTTSPMAPTKDRTTMMENTTRLGMRLDSALRRLYFNTELGHR